jgi:hypothetical protein
MLIAGQKARSIMADSTSQTQQAPGQGTVSAPASGVTVGPISPLSLEDMLDAELAGQTDTQESPPPSKGGRKTKRQAPKAKAEAEEEVIDEIDDDVAAMAEQHDEVENEDADADEPEAEDEEAHAQEEETETESEDEGEETAAEDETDAETDEEGSIEELPKSWQKTVKKLRSEAKSLRDRLKAESARVAPTTDSPLSNLVTEEELNQSLANAKRVRQLFGKVTDADYSEDAQGNEVFTITQGNQTFSYTRAQIEQMLGRAETVLDPEVILERRQYLATREQLNPLDTAEQIVPGIVTDKDSDASKWMARVLGTVPGLRRLPDFEVLLAHAHRDFLRQQETLPTKTHPKGKVKWVRYELDKDGRVLPPKQKASSANGQRPADQAPSSPSGRRAPAAPVRPEARAKAKLDHALSTKSTLSTNEEISSMLAAELAAG